MNNKQKFAIAIITAVLGSGASIFTYNNIITTNIEGDTSIVNNLDIDLTQLREICESGDVPKKYKPACEILDYLP